ncbi:MAG TPA: thrombospondin type 3 repeat-containing protein [bacterium]|nr:thrombospondin type 3 repeat-containing protein [bacterium]
MKRLIQVAWPVLLGPIICLSVLTCSCHDDSVEIAVVDVRGDLPAALGGATAPGLMAELRVAGGAAYPVTLNPDGSLNCFIPGVFAGTHTLTMSFSIPYGPAAAGSGQTKLALGQASMTVYLGPGMNHIIFDLSSLTFPDDDGDGISNLEELLLGTDPLTKNIVEQYLPYLYSYEGIEIRSLFFTSEDDGWAVGYNYDPAPGVILHYQSGGWRVVDVPGIGDDWALESVHFPAADDGWAVGGKQGLGLILHYQNGQWSEVAPPDVDGSWWPLYSVNFPSVDEGWAVGQDPDHGLPVMLHYSSGSWSKVDLSGFGLVYFSLTSVYFTGTDEGWAVGHGNQYVEAIDQNVYFGVVLHYSEGTWTLASAPAGDFDDTRLFSVHFPAADEGWAAGVDENFWEPVIFHYSQGAWSKEDLTGTDVFSGSVYSIYFPSQDEGWAAGKSGGPLDGGLILHYQNGAWTKAVHPSVQVNGPPNEEEWPPTTLYSVHFPTTDRGWFGGTFYYQDKWGDDKQKEMVLSYDAGTWSAASPIYMNRELRIADVSFPSPGEAWAVGMEQGGEILHYQDGAWSNVEPYVVDWGWSPCSSCGANCITCKPWRLNAVDFFSTSLGWAVGQRYDATHNVGAILHYDSGAWAPEPVPDLGPNSWGLYDVNFPAADQGWAVGTYSDGTNLSHGVILNYQSGTWVSVSAPDTGSTSWWLRRVQFPSPDQGWAVGVHCGPNGMCDGAPEDRGILLHYDSGVWSNVTLPDPAPGWYLSSVSFPAEDEGWAVGMACPNWYSECNGIIYHYAGGSWQLDPTPAIGSSVWGLNDVFFPAANEGWAVGVSDWGSQSSHGVVLHYWGGQWQVFDDLIMDPRDMWWTLNSVSCADQDHCLFAGIEVTNLSPINYKGLILKY